MKKTLTSFFLFFTLILSAQNVQNEITKALDHISKQYYNPLVLTLGSFHYDYTESQSLFSRYLESLFEQTIGNMENISLFHRGAVRNMDPEFREVYGDIFELGSTNSILFGRFFEGNFSVRVELNVVSLENGSQIGSAQFHVPKNTIPSHLSISPVEMQEVEKKKDDFRISPDSSTTPISLEITTDRGLNPAYFDGEELQIRFFSNQDVYIKIFHISVHNEVTKIFPNPFHQHAKIPGNTLLQIPGSDYPFKFRLHEPFGREYIKVLASTEPFPENELALESLGNNPAEVFFNALGPEQINGNLAEKLIYYTISPKE